MDLPLERSAAGAKTWTVVRFDPPLSRYRTQLSPCCHYPLTRCAWCSGLLDAMISNLDLYARETEDFAGLEFDCGVEPDPDPGSEAEAETAGDDADCAGSWSACTTACESAAGRTWSETAAQGNGGAACPAAVNCAAGDGDCSVESADVDCVGSWSTCDEACTKTYAVEVDAEGTGAACAVSPGQTAACVAGEGACVTAEATGDPAEDPIDSGPELQPESEPEPEAEPQWTLDPAPEPASVAPAPEPCEGGFWRAAEGDECVAWTPCGVDLEVSVTGSATSDQICGLRLVADTVVAEAVDIEEFSAQMAVASGAASMVTIVITSFEQTITSATNVPGSVADYQSAAAQTQFRSGVALALGVDLSAIGDLSVTDTRRRHARRRQLQDGAVTISYDVVLSDPTEATAVATATKDTAAFAAALVQAVNDVGGGGLALDASSVTVEPPTISTAIEYDIVIQTADAAVLEDVTEQMQDTDVMATALSAATGTTISASDVVATVAQAPATDSTTTPVDVPQAQALDTEDTTGSEATQEQLPMAAIAGGGGAVVVLALLCAFLRCRKTQVVPADLNASGAKYVSSKEESRDKPGQGEAGEELSVVSIDDGENLGATVQAEAGHNLDPAPESADVELLPGQLTADPSPVPQRTVIKHNLTIPERIRAQYEYVRPLQGGGLHSVHVARNSVGKELAAKCFEDELAFQKERENLTAMSDPVGRDYCVELQDADTETHVIYMELAKFSLDQQLKETPDGMDEREIQRYTMRVLDILDHLHHAKRMAHNDLKVENILMCPKDRYTDWLKIADMENASRLGDVRDSKCTAYICPPELAKAICDHQPCKVDPAEDVWAVGVMVLRLMGIERPFQLGDGDDLESKLAPLAGLTDDDVSQVLEQANIPSKSPLESFLFGDQLNPGCLRVRKQRRATVQALRQKGWITLNAGTQVRREGVGQVVSGLQAIEEKVDMVAESQQRMEGAILSLRERVEVVRKTIINLDAEQVPLVFVLELCPTPEDGGAQVSESEAKSLFGRFSQMLQRNNPLDAVKRQLDGLKGKKVKLRLLCQCTWKPVGEGYELHAPREDVPPLLPLLSLGVKGLKAVNLAASVAQVFLGSMLPERLIPNSVLDDATALVDGLPEGLHEYPCVVELSEGAVQAGDSAEAKHQTLSLYQQQQFVLFLKKHDPQEKWRGLLRRVPLADGTVQWVSEAGLSQLEAEGMLDSESDKLQEELEERIAQARQRFETKLAAEIAEKEATMQQQLADADDASEQHIQEQKVKLTAELDRIREDHEDQLRAQAETARQARSQLAQLQMENMDELLRGDTDDSASAGGLMGAMEQESVSVSERIAAMGGDEKRKLRERLDAKKKEQAAKLLGEIN